MLLLLLPLIVFFFLLVGAVVFLLCIALPPPRRYALSAALWCAMWGPCSIAWLLCFGVTLITGFYLARQDQNWQLHTTHLLHQAGWTAVIPGLLASVIVATLSAWVHQFLIQRMTFVLFRLYAAIVCAGIGSVFGWMVYLWSLGSLYQHGAVLGAFAIPILVLLFGYLAYRHAGSLRGEAPTKLTWISEQEFNES